MLAQWMGEAVVEVVAPVQQPVQQPVYQPAPQPVYQQPVYQPAPTQQAVPTFATPAVPVVPATSIDQIKTAEAIERFKALLDSGAITQEEFDAKKKEILGL